jgi:hypothetical protein
VAGGAASRRASKALPDRAPLTQAQSPVHIAEAGLISLKRGLQRAGIATETFGLQADPASPFGWRLCAASNKSLGVSSGCLPTLARLPSGLADSQNRLGGVPFRVSWVRYATPELNPTHMSSHSRAPVC